MKKNLLQIGLCAMAAVALFSCSKNNDKVNISKPLKIVGQPLSDTTLPVMVNGKPQPIKGTMLAGKTYHIMSDISINAGDTLYLQPGVKVFVHGNGIEGSTPMIVVRGSLISDGTKESPNWFTVDPSQPKSNATLTDNANTDPAYKGYWAGIQGDSTCLLMAFRWTHIEYTGATYGTRGTAWGAKDGDATPMLYMNPKESGPYGKLIIEDSWLFGSADDGVGKCQHVYVSIMRNTISKIGGIGGEGINLKNDCIGDMAYNFCYGVATNGLKTAGIAGSSSIVNIYNNTLVNCGFRQTKATRNGSINTETNAGGYIYNNIIANCKQGLRITYTSEKGKPSDTLNTSYGNNLTYVGRPKPMGGAEQYMLYIEPNQFTKKQPTDINGYINGVDKPTGQNDGRNENDSLKYNPQFVNYNVLTNSLGTSYRYAVIPSGADFRLASSSPAIGKGVYAGGSGDNAIPSKAKAPLLTRYGFPSSITLLAGLANVTPPNKDLGAFPSDGSGNQHTY